MSSAITSVKVIDFSELSLKKDGYAEEDVMRGLGAQIIESLEKDGAFILKNAGLCASDQVVKDVWKSFDDFRPLPFEQRQPYVAVPKDLPFPVPMYSPPHTDGSFRNSDDIVESLSYWSCLHENVYPEKEVPGIRQRMQAILETGVQVLLRLLDCMAVAAKLDRDKIRGSFRRLLAKENRSNYTQLRLNYIAPANKGDDLQNALPRMAHHKDITVLTLDIPSRRGLQIQARSGDWVAVPFIPDTSVIMAGTILPLLFDGNFHIPEHQVLCTNTEEDFVERKSTICFLGADYDCLPDTGATSGTESKPGTAVIKDMYKTLHYGDVIKN